MLLLLVYSAYLRYSSSSPSNSLSVSVDWDTVRSALDKDRIWRILEDGDAYWS